MNNYIFIFNEKLKKITIFFRFKFAEKIIIGSAGISSPGWLETDKESLDVIKRESFARYWKPNSRQLFFAEHVWEHLNDDEATEANQNCFDFLKSGGQLRIAVPDGFHPDPEYIEMVRPDGIGSGAKEHKVLYNYKSLSEKLKYAGFEVELLEYWDENGQFHFKDWSSEKGHVRRSKRYDKRNNDGNLTYTSLIVDGRKP